MRKIPFLAGINVKDDRARHVKLEGRVGVV